MPERMQIMSHGSEGMPTYAQFIEDDDEVRGEIVRQIDNEISADGTWQNRNLAGLFDEYRAENELFGRPEEMSDKQLDMLEWVILHGDLPEPPELNDASLGEYMTVENHEGVQDIIAMRELFDLDREMWVREWLHNANEFVRDMICDNPDDIPLLDSAVAKLERDDIRLTVNQTRLLRARITRYLRLLNNGRYESSARVIE